MSGSFAQTFSNTLEIALLGTLLCFLIAFPFAYWLAVKVPSRWRPLVLALVMVPFWTNFLVRTIGWRMILSGDGALSGLLQDLGVIGEPLALLYTRAAVQIGVVYNYLPLMILPLFVALDRLDPSLREASKDLGASRWSTLVNVTLPLATPGIVAGLLLVFIPLMGDYITAVVLGGAKGNMVGQLVATQFQVGQNWALGSAVAVVLILVILLTVLVAALVGLALRAVVRARRRVGAPA
jgi:spermidine/putrescine transport system permease protein